MPLRTEVVESGKEAEDEEAERQHDEDDNVGGLYHEAAIGGVQRGGEGEIKPKNKLGR